MLWLQAVIFLCFMTLGYGGPVGTQDIVLRVISLEIPGIDETRLTCESGRFRLYENIPTRIHINSGFICYYICFSIKTLELLNVTALSHHVENTFVAEVQNVFESKFECVFYVNKGMSIIGLRKYINGADNVSLATAEVGEAVAPYDSFDTSSTMKQEGPEGTDGGLPRKYLGPVAGGSTVLLILLFIVFVFLKLRRRKLQKNYTNFSNSNPNSKSKTNVNTISDYAVPVDLLDIKSEYTLPYNQNLEEMYAQPKPKNERDENKVKEVIYAEIEFSETDDDKAGGPKIRGLGAVECAYAELISNNQHLYVNAMPKVTRDNEFKSSMNKEFLETDYCNVGTLKTNEGFKS